MIPGVTGVVTPSRSRSARKSNHTWGSKKNCETPKSADRELLRLPAPVLGHLRGRGMTLGVHRDTDRERVELARELDQVGGMVELARRQVQVLGRIAAQREHVLHAGFGVAPEDLLELRARGAADVRWAIAVIEVCSLIHTTRSCVRSRVVPPAP